MMVKIKLLKYHAASLQESGMKENRFTIQELKDKLSYDCEAAKKYFGKFARTE
jgi:hypothetical protein